MEAWQEKRGVHTMNLRSVFTAEQQSILERYYENGMTNQSKSCFQLILQCAQETKLDFSVVRTWVGNKRRKLASRADKNGVVGLSNHAIVGAGGCLGPVLTADMAAVRSVQRGPSTIHHLSPQASCPSSSSTSSSSSSSSSSPSSNGSKNNNDVIVTGAYSLPRIVNRLESSSQSRADAKVLPLNPSSDSSLHSRLVLPPDEVSLQRKSPHIHNSSTLMFNQMRRMPRDLASVAPSWAKQCGAPQHQQWLQTSTQQPMTNLHRTPPASAAESGVRIQQVFTIAGLAEGSQQHSTEISQDHRTKKTSVSSEYSETFSIAMETGDADDEYSREEELANMGAQLQLSKSAGSNVGEVENSRILTEQPSTINRQGMYTVTSRNLLEVAHSSPSSAHFGEKGCQTSSALLFDSGSRASNPIRHFTESSPSRIPNLKVSIMSSPWLLSNSRKRTLQDRTQFSDGDLYALKRYWDNGMTSLGSVCKEKIAAAAIELSVDSEIIKTWIGNRRRKYRLMGIDIPPPKGGPATFSKLSSAKPQSPLTPEGDKSVEPLQESEQNDAVSLCLSEDGPRDSYLQENDDENDGLNISAIADNVKIEIIDEGENDEDDCEVMASDMEHMHNILEYKHEEVQYLESELERQKQKYRELSTFTKSLLTALKNKDTEKQHELLASLPHQVEEDIVSSPERNAESSMEMSSNQKDSSVSEGEGDIEPNGQ
ncbi:highly divergent homeobox isoform X1 [Clarias gariepinus]|uniref:highly divergent homeobox isoform X1 n=1 Tax=Clarias gariepinus TaxID=13013 RepID=UPI00234E109F|nr:highly divergent homeobox isoform X1 [Clarias gariepinus]XP_053362606.1 highly divergent homeobox isoform X1 [Clarias gariepinus]XP_053362607.1 highly divergent homeobox isoform X1 [Clarias gariepinus]